MKKLLTINDVAQRGAVSGATVRLWDRTGKLEAIRTAGGMRLFAEDQVTKFLAARAKEKAQKAEATPQKSMVSVK